MDVETALSGYARRVDEALFAALADVEPPTLREACEHYPRAGGKRLRPAMALLAAEALGAGPEDAMPLAVALELVHDFSLVHDDIMDRDDTRRGRPSVHVRWDEATAILAGDTLFAKAFEVLAEAPAPAAVRVTLLSDVARMTRVICHGQALDMAFEGQDVDEAAYLDMIYRKTARIFETAAMGGALLAGADTDAVAELRGYGRAIGIAFQVQDDLLDLQGTTDQIGKPARSDIRAGKRTVVYLHARANADEAQSRILDAGFGDPRADDAAVDAVLQVFVDTQAVAHAEELVRQYTDEAIHHLDALPDTPARTLLTELAEWAAGRDR